MEADLKPSEPAAITAADVPSAHEAPILSIVREPQPSRATEIPRATYRVQLNKSFTFKDATAIVPYLAALGISHVYCSPYFKARGPAACTAMTSSITTSSIPEIGDRADFDHFVAALRAHGMGHILDIVPNHVGIMGSDNAWWMDVLENGQASAYADYFDIEWNPANPALKGKVLVPVLGEPYGVVLGKGELALRFERELGSFAVFYHEHRMPVDPRTYPLILDRGARGDLQRRDGELCGAASSGAGRPPRSHRRARSAERAPGIPETLQARGWPSSVAPANRPSVRPSEPP